MLSCMRWRVIGGLALVLSLWPGLAGAQDRPSRPAALPRELFKSGALTLRAFRPVEEATRDSIVKFTQENNPVTLGAVIDASGLVITKASEIKPGKLMCQLADGREVEAEVMASDEGSDVALVRVAAACLRPIEWSASEAIVGQWVVTPGTGLVPETVGILSVPARKIPHRRAYMGVILTNASAARIVQVAPESGAAKAGLKPGDVVLAVNDLPVKDREELTTRLETFRGGQEVRLRVRREEREFDAGVRLSARAFEFWPDFNRQSAMNRLGGKVSQRAEDFELAWQHDSVLQPWQCGGPLVNLEGKAIGINIARAGRTASYALPAALVTRLADELKARLATPRKMERGERGAETGPAQH